MCMPGSEVEASNSEQASDREWWKTAPKLEVPWPPLGDDQSKASFEWDNGPSANWTFPEVSVPSDGAETLFEAPPVQVQTPVPGVVLDLFAEAEWGLRFSAGVGFSLQKEGDRYTATGRGQISGKALVAIKGGIGVGAGGAGVSIGVSGNLEGAVEAELSGAVELSLVHDGRGWAGEFKTPLDFMAAVKVTPSASLYVRVWKYRKDLATLTLGEWTIAHAGISWTPGVRYDGSGFSNLTARPTVRGPDWGAPPEAEEAA
ncbi:MAG: hypothetical protein EA397_07880 [Deltaproteobacteria bacterium]|nr:MAG: hypothetical protein EA397_07880 [Deltaproteobacteria bacterium]